MTAVSDMEVSRMSSKGQVTIPKSIRERLNLKEGDRVAFIEDENGNVTITKASTLAFNRIADKIARMAEEKGITEEELLETLERVREERYRERYRD
ncbi:AbrB/MazE/SpoVT family DNA-binding domain-containing protein [Polycladomyces zharkentensis]|nr:AbrB/MazE/SpoVT family DNA-binding domain-containing protein [Polycladomyces sp. WAk]